MITYASYIAGITTLIHGEHNGKTLVLGFMLINNDLKEKRYAIHKDGRVKETNWLERGNYFNRAGLTWKDTDFINIYAEFIGQYVDDIF